ncbi:DUF2185 domain-containing protein [Mariniluteicoccus flavus]
MTTEFIKDAGAVIVTKSVLEGRTPLKWIVRDEPIEPPDTGWRFMGMHDTQAYLDDPANSVVADFNTVAEIEPAVIGIYNFPVGTDLQLVEHQDGRKEFVDNETGQPIDPATLR